jgi:hypothetical protein
MNENDETYELPVKEYRRGGGKKRVRVGEKTTEPLDYFYSRGL